MLFTKYKCKVPNNIHVQLQNKFPDIGNQINHGSYGRVFNMNNSNSVLKVFANSTNDVLKLTKEINMAVFLSKKHIGPAVHFRNITYFNEIPYGIIVFEKYEATLDSLIRNKNISHIVKEDAIIQSRNLVSKIHNLGIVHRDLHSENFMYKPENSNNIDNFVKVCIIDFGSSEKNCKTSINYNVNMLENMTNELFNIIYD